MGASTVMSVSSTLKAGDQAEKDAKAEAYEMEQAGIADYARATHESYEEARQGRIVESNARARMAGSGGVTTDAGATDMLAEIGRDTDYNSMAALFEGKSRREDWVRKAAKRRQEGKIAKKASRRQAVATALQGGSQLFSAFSKPKTDGVQPHKMKADVKANPYRHPSQMARYR